MTQKMSRLKLWDEIWDKSRSKAERRRKSKIGTPQLSWLITHLPHTVYITATCLQWPPAQSISFFHSELQENCSIILKIHMSPYLLLLVIFLQGLRLALLFCWQYKTDVFLFPLLLPPMCFSTSPSLTLISVWFAILPCDKVDSFCLAHSDSVSVLRLSLHSCWPCGTDDGDVRVYTASGQLCVSV